jgi:hypothetical protein
VRVSKIIGLAIFSLLSASAAVFAAPASSATIVLENKSTLGIIKGVVRDDGGSPISDATVAIFRGGTSKLLKQVSSGSDGSFIAKILPGTYTVLAVAQGFNPITLFGVEVGRAAEVSYGFKLERAGSGNTLPEKKLDRSSSKWRIRAAQSQRSIYQNHEGDVPQVGGEADEEVATDEAPNKGRGQTVIETYFASSDSGNFSGVNFATLLPVGRSSNIVVAGQFASSKNAPQRIETAFKFHPALAHEVRFDSSFSRSAKVGNKALGQFSVQATDEWKIRDGVILVLGFDYSQFTGSGNDSSLSPRIGLQYDVDSKTRVRTAFTTQTEERSWAHAIDLEDQSIGFAEPISVQDLYVVDGRPRMNKTRRFEFGVERILDNRSSIEANAFVDMTLGRGVGLNAFAFDTLDGAGFSDVVANQEGRSTGLRLVYTRRINNVLTANAGYAFGSGQRLSRRGLNDPADMFEGDFFHSFFAELAASLKTGTNIRTIVRLSPEATVFAIDPFKGRLAIYDPGLSVLVTQSLPTLGLPIKAEAVVDARNIFDLESGVFGEEGGLRLNAQRRTFRGGIQVRF